MRGTVPEFNIREIFVERESLKDRRSKVSPGMERLIEYLLIIIKHSAIRRERETNIQGGGGEGVGEERQKED